MAAVKMNVHYTIHNVMFSLHCAQPGPGWGPARAGRRSSAGRVNPLGFRGGDERRIQRYNDVNRDAGYSRSTSAAQWTSKMKNDAGEKSFDVMKWLRATRAEIYEETKNMSIDERRQWESQRPTDPVLARLFDRRRAPKGGRRGPERSQPQGIPE